MRATLNKVGVGLLGLGCVSAMAVGGVTVAQAAGSSSSVHACAAKATHVLHLGHCKRGERAITLSERGPQGPRGLNGPAGPGAVVWQALVNSAGTVQYAHAGITVDTTGTNHYTVSWSGFPGTALPYCVALGTAPLETTKIVLGPTSGYAEVSTTSQDGPFWCQIVQE